MATITRHNTYVIQGSSIVVENHAIQGVSAQKKKKKSFEITNANGQSVFSIGESFLQESTEVFFDEMVLHLDDADTANMMTQSRYQEIQSVSGSGNYDQITTLEILPFGSRVLVKYIPVQSLR